MKVTTTSTLQDIEIIEYLNTLSSSVVIGMNAFNDFKSSVTDFFGGPSNSYIALLEKVKKEAVDELKRKAGFLKADYIIGLTINTEEISAQGKSMLMVSTLGTAVKTQANHYLYPAFLHHSL